MIADNRVVIVTGASSGIGEAVALRMCHHAGWRVLLQGRNPDTTASVLARCREIASDRIESVVGDIRNDNVQRNVVDKASRLGPIRALVNSAGAGAFGSFTDADMGTVRTLFEVNVLAALRMCQLSIPLLSTNGGGTIVNISSDADSVGFEGATAYCGTKAALLGASRALRMEVGRLGIRVPVISPGRVDTHFNNKHPGMRPGALAADEVAEIVEFAITCGANIDLSEIRFDSLARWRH